MALSSFLRRASFAPSLPLAIRRSAASLSSNSNKLQDASQNITKIINRQIKLASNQIHDLEEEKPFGFPFETEDNQGTKVVSLKRKFRNEHIAVTVDLANGVNEEKEGDGDSLDQVSIPLVIAIDKGLGFRLEFGVTAYPGEIVVEYMVTKSPGITDHGVPYEGRDFRDLEENMQKAIFEYLAVRGIEPNVMGFLIAYMMAKGGKEYLHWLKILRQFCH